jgi:hypothetical protein
MISPPFVEYLMQGLHNLWQLDWRCQASGHPKAFGALGIHSV